MPKIVQFHELGGPEVLKIEEWEAPALQEGEVLLDVAAFALNRADILFFQGLHYTFPNMPSRLGSEASGTIAAVGEGVDDFAVGDKVSTIPFANARYGVHGEQAVAHQDFLAPWPDELSAIEATSIWMQYLTAYYPIVEIGEAREGDFVLVTAASSSAGLGAIEIARDAGASVIATTRSGSKSDAILSAGAHHVIATDKEDVAGRIMEISGGKGVRVIYDAVGGSLYDRYLDALAEDARIILYGLLDDEPTKIDVVKMVRKNAIMHPYSMFNEVRHAERLERGMAYILERLKDGRFKPRINDQVFTMENAVDAYRYMLGGEQIGKIVVRASG
ncbi:zinc-dependent alcohol dehydrogenase family protein [Parasphingopyxis algicola]|uniref:zinc-dependent alcohol dehydrogenase family protein n=1 Tax=Parasphingopyxis algicola TaxID=2026624 RepID=UPI0015A0E35A|nr:zinc-dependent alcohol dehydrogenase family protein [Parasphingopyxis algicola]QLC25216.1 zinc-dependent alcohol dehydrogenase family protein [Parasphingopyxis algicola]